MTDPLPLSQKRAEWKALAAFWKDKNAGTSSYYQHLYDGTHDAFREHMRACLHGHDGHERRKAARE